MLKEVRHVTKKDCSNYTALMLCVIGKCNLDVIRLLLEHGADIKDCDNYNNNLLHLCVMVENLDAIKYLIEEKKMNKDVTNLSKYTPLDFAEYYEKKGIATYLKSIAPKSKVKYYEKVETVEEKIEKHKKEIENVQKEILQLQTENVELENKINNKIIEEHLKASNDLSLAKEQLKLQEEASQKEIVQLQAAQLQLKQASDKCADIDKETKISVEIYIDHEKLFNETVAASTAASKEKVQLEQKENTYKDEQLNIQFKQDLLELKELSNMAIYNKTMEYSEEAVFKGANKKELISVLKANTELIAKHAH